MCGIIGLFNDKDASAKVKAALALLHKRGKDAAGVASETQVYHAKEYQQLTIPSENNLLGHTLHAVVDCIPQPLKGKGILAANCEIYNWQELNRKYNFAARNDAELLLSFLDKYGLEKLDELDGVYAFAYWHRDTLYLVRDIIGEKPLWYAHADSFAFASEKKVLEALGFLDIQELNPRTIVKYTITSNGVEFQRREFFTYLPEHQDTFPILKEKTAFLLDHAIQKRVPQQKFGLLFSGGIDSTYLAKFFKDKGIDFTCYTAGLDSGTPAVDLEQAQSVANKLGLQLKVRTIKLEEVPAYLQKIVPLIEDSNVIKVGVALPFYLACEMAKEDGCKVIFSGLGSEELFAGYERHRQSANINQECISGLLKMYERDLYRDDVVTMAHQMELRLPFLDVPLVQYALKIPEQHKIKDGIAKYILREIAMDKGIPPQFALRKKMAAQYGSRFDHALGKLAKKNGFPSKSAYLRTFYPTPNLKLGVLFSGGKDSTYAASIMQKQNYELACLITLRSENPDSYMFHTPAIEITSLQAEAMKLPIIIQSTKGEKEHELRDLEKAMRLAQEKYKIEGIVSGAVFSTYQRNRIEKLCDKLGLKIFAPLWHKQQEEELHELLNAGFRFVFTAVAAQGLDKSWLNKVITETEIAQLHALHLKYGINEAGEGGETESLVLSCPLFQKSIKLDRVEIIEEGKNTARVNVIAAHLEEK